MSLTVNTKAYALDSQVSANSVRYTGPAKTLSVKDDIQLSRTVPKPTGVFSGVARTECKLTRTLALTGALTSSADAIMTLSTSVPVGAASADVEAMLDDLAAWFATSAASDLVQKLDINQ